jgi:hypothetical protein
VYKTGVPLKYRVAKSAAYCLITDCCISNKNTELCMFIFNEQIQVPDDYQSWHETLCTEFPSRFNRLFRGPMCVDLVQDQQKQPLNVMF